MLTADWNGKLHIKDASADFDLLWCILNSLEGGACAQNFAKTELGMAIFQTMYMSHNLFADAPRRLGHAI